MQPNPRRGYPNSPNSGYKTCAFKAPLPSLGEGFGVRAKCSGEVQNWHYAIAKE